MLDALIIIFALCLVVMAFCGLAGFSPSKIWHRARGDSSYGGSWQDGKKHLDDGGGHGGDSSGGDV